MKGNESHTVQRTNSLLQKTPIAIIGMGALFPQARNLQQYWDNILREVDCITDVPPSRWDIADYYDPDPHAPDKTYCKRGGFIPDVDFNPMEFGIPPNVLEATDISQLLSLVVARHTLQDAGYEDQADAILARTGVILGVAVGRQLGVPLTSRLQYPIWERALKNYGLPDADVQHLVEQMKAAYVGWQENSFPGVLGNVVAGRIANRFNLGGANCVVDAACASSLSALKMAISELLEQRSDMMLTGGVDTDNSIMMYMCFSKTPAFSQQEHVRPFDVDSDGMMVGEGLGMVLLKRLADAERDEDRIYAVIRGIGSASDGRFKSIYAPRSEGQATALRRAYADAGVSPSTIGLVEAHGTGTKAGDPVEVTALRDVLQEADTPPRRVGLGSVKGQIGHTKAAAGAASLIKTALALYHQVLPATINVEQPMAPLAAADSPLYLNTHTRPWLRSPQDPPRRAGVSAFGFGGTNFHVVLEEYAQVADTNTHSNLNSVAGVDPIAYRLQRVPQPIVLHAPTPADLIARCEEILAQLREHTSAHPDAHMLRRVSTANNAADMPADQPRLGFVADTPDEACAHLEIALQMLRNLAQSPDQATEWTHPNGLFYRAAALDPAQKVVALFPGQGSQYVEMGRALACTMPPVRNAFSAIDALFQQDGLEPVSRVVFPPPGFDDETHQAQADALRQTQYAQPAIGAFSLALYTLLRQAGFQPDFALGHSFGELTALWAAGVLNEADYLRLIKARGLAMAAPPAPDFDAGAMLAVQGDAAQIQAACPADPALTIANWNAPDQVVLAGPTPAIDAAHSSLSARGFKSMRLPVSAAFHTELVEHARQPFAEIIRHADINAPDVPVYANATAEPYPAAPSAIRHMLAEHIIQPVRFQQQIEQVYAAGGFCFVEIGPKNTLTNLVQRILADKPHVTVALNASRRTDSDRQYRSALVQLRVLGLPLALADPYQAPLPAENPASSTPLSVRLSASNHVSEKTKQAYTDALHRGAGSKKAGQKEPGPENTAQNGHGEVERPPAAVSALRAPFASVATEAEPVTEAAKQTARQIRAESPQNGAHTAAPSASTTNNRIAAHTQPPPATGQTNGYGSPHPPANSRTTVERSALESPPPGTQTPAARPDHQRLLDGLEHSLAHFMEGQNQSARVHEQYLNHQGDYAQRFAQLMQQQLDLVNHDATPEQLAAVRTLLETLNQSVAQFHAHQGETTRIHEHYLRQQTESTRTILQIMQQQYAAGLGQPAPPSDVAAHTEQMPHTTAEQAEPPAPAAQPPSASASDPTHAPAATATDLAQPAAAPAADTAALTEMLLESVSEKTGYPIEVLEPEMDIEADLGIDSIKRVEILGALQEQFPAMPAAEPEALGELRTLGQIVAFIENTLATHTIPTPNGSAHDTTPSAPTPSTGPTSASPAAAAAPAAAPAIDAAALTEMLLEIVSEKTGYPIEVLEPEMDIEADLGIDSIKRVEILGALQEQFPAMPAAEPEALGELRTLGQIIDFIGERLNADAPNGVDDAPDPLPSAGAETTTSAPDPAMNETRHAPDAPTPAADSPAADSSGAAGAVTPALRRVISEMTSLPPDVLEPDMELDADLGIDRVKCVAIISALQEQLPELAHIRGEDLADQPTIGHLARALTAHISPAPATEPVTETDSTTLAAETDFTVETPEQTHSPEMHSIERQRVELQPLPLPDFLEFQPAPDHICLVTDDGGPTTPQLVNALHARGWSVVVLAFPPEIIPATATDAWETLPAAIPRVTLSDTSEDHLAQQLQTIATEQGPIGAFIHIHPVLPLETEELAFLAAEKAIVKGVFFAVKHLREPLHNAAQHGRSCFLTVTRLDGQFGLDCTEPFGAIGAGLCGLTKSLKQEWPGVFCRTVDVSRTWDAAQTADAILAELHDPATDLREVGYGASGRVTLTTRPAPLHESALSSDEPAIDAASVFLVSGGGKGITAACVVRLAQHYQCKFILLGRSALDDSEPAWAEGITDEADLKKRIVVELSAQGEKPKPAAVQALYRRIISRREIAETVRQIERAGGQARYCSVDITDGAALRTAVTNAVQELGPVSGIIHGAGALADAWIEKKTEADFDLVYATKVTGLENLLHVVPPAQLRHLVLFTSTAGFYGNVGQTDYALGNEVLNKTAHLVQRRHPACRAVAINWGPWDGGMVTPALKRIFAMQNIEVIPLEVGAQRLVDEVGAVDREATQVVISSPVQFGMLSPEVDRPAGQLRTFRVHRTLRSEANPFLRDHAIGEQQVLPLTAAAAWMINTCEQLNPGYTFCGWTDLRVLKGIVLDDTGPDDTGPDNAGPDDATPVTLTLDLQEETGASTALVAFAARIWSEDAQGQPRYHYQGTLTLAQHTPPPPRYESFVIEPDAALADVAPYQNGALFHGPAFQGVERVLYAAPERLTLACRAPTVSAATQGQFRARRFDPYLTDVQLQSGLIWSRQINAQSCLPAKVAQYELYELIPSGMPFYVSLEVRSHTNAKLVADIIAHDEEGRVYSRLSGSEYTVSNRLTELFEQAIASRRA